MDPTFTSITECVDHAGQQYAAHPRSRLSRTLEQWARATDGIDVENGQYPVALAAHKWIQAGFLLPSFLPLDRPYPSRRETPGEAYGMWLTARQLVGLPQPTA